MDAAEIVRRSGVYAAIDDAKMNRRISAKIDPSSWDRIRPLVQRLCGQYFRSMEAPWRCFMLDGIWIEAA